MSGTELSKTPAECMPANDPRTAAILESALDCIILMNHEGRIVEFNHAAEQILGFQRSTILDQHLADWIIPPTHRVAHCQGLARFLSAGEGPILGKLLELTASRADGSEIPVEMTVSRVRQPGPPLFIAILRDISQRKETELALRESEDRFRTAFDSASVGISLAAPDGRWLKVNSALCQLVGYSEQELLNKCFQDITHPDDLARDEIQVRKMLAGETDVFQAEKRFIHKSGDIIWIFLSVTLLRDRFRKPLHFIAYTQDITRRKKALAELEERTRINALAADIGMSLTRSNSMQNLLQDCAQALVKHLDAAFARIWTLNEPKNMLELQASAGMYTHIDGPHGSVPVGSRAQPEQPRQRRQWSSSRRRPCPLPG